MRLIAAIALMFTLHVATPVVAQREDTTSFVVIKDDKQVIYDLLFRTFKEKNVGLLPFFCEDEIEFSVYTSQDSSITECMSRSRSMDNLRGFFMGMSYEGFSFYTADTVFGSVAFFKILMDLGRPDYVIYMYFVIDPNTLKINKIIVE